MKITYAVSLGLLFIIALPVHAAKKLEYTPNPPLAKKYMFKMKVVVAPFKDKTEDFKIKRPQFRVPIFTANMAKYKKRRSTYLPATLLTELFIEDLSNSRVFRSVEPLTKKTKLDEKDLKLQGVLKEATFINRDTAEEKEDEVKLDIIFEAIDLSNDEVIWKNEYKMHLKGEWYPPPDKKVSNALREIFEKVIGELIIRINELKAPPKPEDLIPRDDSELSTDEFLNKMQEAVEDAQ